MGLLEYLVMVSIVPCTPIHTGPGVSNALRSMDAIRSGGSIRRLDAISSLAEWPAVQDPSHMHTRDVQPGPTRDALRARGEAL
jgi:hypothetical protein